MRCTLPYMSHALQACSSEPQDDQRRSRPHPPAIQGTQPLWRSTGGIRRTLRHDLHALTHEACPAGLKA